jgi:SLAP domain-containing protein
MCDYLNTKKGNDVHILTFEDAWERTVAASDKIRLISLFESAPEVESGEVSFLPYRVAYNHRGELLASVIIQNGRNEELLMRDMAIVFEDAKGNQVGHSFSFPRLVIAENTSTPWTFIFPKNVVGTKELDFSSWKLILKTGLKFT